MSRRELLTIPVSEEPTWFNGIDHPLFGWLTQPTASPLRGAVVLAPPIGYEARNAKAAFQQLARELSREGLATLRIDYRGTGDSSGTFGSALPDPDWVEDVAHAVEYFAAAGFEQVSIVGMRLGATLAAHAIARLSPSVHAVVLWDPCESGRAYLREVHALGALRSDQTVESEDGAIETIEYLFNADMVNSLKTLNVRVIGDTVGSTRYLLVSRRTRPPSSAVRQALEEKEADFLLTDEQEACFDALPFYARLPQDTIEQIARWLTRMSSSQSTFPRASGESQAVLDSGEGYLVRERAGFIGLQRNFGVITEPISGYTGPHVVFLQNVHEDHNGPSRMWVDLSRQLAGIGVRSARIDVSGLGDTQRGEGLPPAQYLDEEWTREVVSVCEALEPSDPSNVILVGLCSGATLAIEAAWRLRAGGLCIINPPLGINVLHHISKWQDSRTSLGRQWGRWLRRRYRAHTWIVVTLWELIRVLRPPRWRADIISRAQSRGTDVLVLSSVDEFVAFDRVPFVRRLDGRQLGVARAYPFEVVPDLDHGLTVAAGRRRVAERVIQHVSQRLADETGDEVTKSSR